MTTVLYRVRAQSPSETEDAYVTRNANGLPTWTWEKTEPLLLGSAKILMGEARRLCGGTLYLERIKR